MGRCHVHEEELSDYDDDDPCSDYYNNDPCSDYHGTCWRIH